MYSVYLCVLRPAFASWMRKNPQKPRGRLLMFLKHVTTCNGMHADWLPSADPWWFQVWLRWKRNRKVSKSRANSRQFGCLSSASRARCQQYTCRVRAHQRGGHMVQINHLIFFFFGWCRGRHVTVALALNDCSAAAGRLGTWRAATVLLRLWKRSKRHHYHRLHSHLGSAFGPVPFISNVDLIGLEGRNSTLQGQSNLYNL